eukprot:1465797-Amphidinium_carterae.1
MMFVRICSYWLHQRSDGLRWNMNCEACVCFDNAIISQAFVNWVLEKSLVGDSFLTDDWDLKDVISCLHALRLGRRQPKGMHRDLASRSDRDADEGRLERVDVQGNRMADVVANKGISEHVPLEPSEEWKHWSTVCQVVRNCWLLVGPIRRICLEQWPRVRLPTPEPEPEIVETVSTAALPGLLRL